MKTGRVDGAVELNTRLNRYLGKCRA
jgi:hypothetical protein